MMKETEALKESLSDMDNYFLKSYIRADNVLMSTTSMKASSSFVIKQ